MTAAKQNEAKEMSFAAGSVLASAFSGSDLARSTGEARREVLDAALQRDFSKGDGVLAVSVSGPNGRITYSTNHRLIGEPIGPPGYVDDALKIRNRTGQVISVRGKIADPDKPGQTLPTLNVYAPLFPHDYGHGVVVVSVDYKRVVAAAMSWFYPVAGILEGTLVLLYILLLPLLWRVSKRLREQLEKIKHQAYHDNLTTLPNRLQFRERVEQIVGQQQQLAVMIIDLDRFKEINDTLGHHAGDELLRLLSVRLHEEAPREVLIARLGGDEFGVLIPNATVDDALGVAARINEVLGENFTVRDVPLGVEASIGIAVAPEHGSDVDTLMQRADLAMYDAKGRYASVAVYSDHLDQSNGAQIGLLAELRRALDEQELILHYQPKVAFATGEISGVEALVRWQHPSRGLLYPNEFLSYAEHTGLNRVLTSYVLEKALRQRQRWQEEALELNVAVNITMYDLLDPSFPDDVQHLLEITNVDPTNLELEITETSIMSDASRVRDNLQQLHALGVRIAIDDFGSGYSSLAYLMNLEVDTLKIDKAFVLGMSNGGRNASIVKTIIDLAHVCDLKVVAEGVETQEDWQTLNNHGCDTAQGFLISKPVSPDSLAKLAADRTNAQSVLAYAR
ncbi:MAG TPA: EAL domain-containing protein [Gaiellaceae bacterium]|nr:EAL domain-containing protein [Gaiellaceae bacterium]